MSDAATILGLLADHDRMKVVAALVLGAESADDVSQATGLDGRTVARALSRLVAGGVVSVEDRRYRLAVEHLAEAARSIRPADPPPDDGVEPHLRTFVRDGTLRAIPTGHGKRLVILEWLAQRFEPGRVYPEAEVNALLSTAHPDYAALRRYLVDDGFLDRRQGKYWRIGGVFDVDGNPRGDAAS
jgi:DNA-binding transcriptional ArsR family regulator